MIKEANSGGLQHNREKKGKRKMCWNGKIVIKGEAYFVIILNIDDHIMFGIALNKYHRKLDLSHQSAVSNWNMDWAMPCLSKQTNNHVSCYRSHCNWFRPLPRGCPLFYLSIFNLKLVIKCSSLVWGFLWSREKTQI